MKTIQFNTGRKYTAEGQIITATLHDDGMVTFMDHSRMVDGTFECSDPELFCQGMVMAKYDNYLAPGTKRSFEDGMQRGGCNTRKDVR